MQSQTECQSTACGPADTAAKISPKTNSTTTTATNIIVKQTNKATNCCAIKSDTNQKIPTNHLVRASWLVRIQSGYLH